MKVVVVRLREQAGRIQADGEPLVAEARRRALKAVDIVDAALAVDPTLPDPDRHERFLDLITEVLRQLVPLAKQAQILLEARSAATSPPWRVNADADIELDALSARGLELAAMLRDQAWPDWDSPQRRKERAASLMPDPGHLADIAEQLREAVAPALALADVPEALRLAAISDLIAPRPGICAAPGCDRELSTAPTGRPRRYCGDTCRQRAHRRGGLRPTYVTGRHPVGGD